MSSCKRPCKICRRWFQPHPRAGDRQRVCSGPACQQERHRRADRAWHARHPDYDKKRRLREGAGFPDEACVDEDADDPLAQLDWGLIERAIGPKPRVVMEGIGRLLVRHAQDAVAAISQEEPGQADRLLNGCSQDAVASETGEGTGYPPRLPRSGHKTQSDPAARDP